MNFNLHYGELHSDNSINDKNNLFENYIPKCYKVIRILISFNCFSEYIYNHLLTTDRTSLVSIEIVLKLQKRTARIIFFYSFKDMFDLLKWMPIHKRLTL